MNTRFVGDSALLIDVEDAQAAQQLRVAILRHSLRGLYEVVPAYNTLLIEFDAHNFDVNNFIHRLPRFVQEHVTSNLFREHVIDVTYDGEDLSQVAKETGLDTVEIVQCHSSAIYTVAFLGFAPGFTYLTGLDPKLRVPRLKSPRTRVPVGSVAIADEFSGIYPQTMPGGWRILGHTHIMLFDPECASPALLTPGDTVHFRSMA